MKKDTVDDMKEAEADDPKQQSIIFYKTIGQAESDFRITQIAGSGKRIIRRTDQSDALEYQHDRRSKAIMALPDQWYTKYSAYNQRQEEIPQ